MAVRSPFYPYPGRLRPSSHGSALGVERLHNRIRKQWSVHDSACCRPPPSSSSLPPPPHLPANLLATIPLLGGAYPAGSTGKTTTSWLVRGIFEEMVLRTGMIGSLEYALGIDRMTHDGNMWESAEEDPTIERCPTPPPPSCLLPPAPHFRSAALAHPQNKAIA